MTTLFLIDLWSFCCFFSIKKTFRYISVLLADNIRHATLCLICLYFQTRQQGQYLSLKIPFTMFLNDSFLFAHTCWKVISFCEAHRCSKVVRDILHRRQTVIHQAGTISCSLSVIKCRNKHSLAFLKQIFPLMTSVHWLNYINPAFMRSLRNIIFTS